MWAIGAARDSAVGAVRRNLGTSIDARADYCFDPGASTKAASTRCARVAICETGAALRLGNCVQCRAGTHGDRDAWLHVSEVSSPGGAAEAAALVLAPQEFVGNGGGRHGAAGVLHRRGRRAALAGSVSVGWWRSNSQLSPPRRQTSGFSGGSGGLAPPARRLVLVQRDNADSDELRPRNPSRSISATPGGAWRLLLGATEEVVLARAETVGSRCPIRGLVWPGGTESHTGMGEAGSGLRSARSTGTLQARSILSGQPGDGRSG